MKVMQRYRLIGMTALFFLNNLCAMQSPHDVLTQIEEMYSQRIGRLAEDVIEAATADAYLYLCKQVAERQPHDPARLAFWQCKLTAVTGAEHELLSQEDSTAHQPIVRILKIIKVRIQFMCDSLQATDEPGLLSRWGTRARWAGSAVYHAGRTVASAANPMRFLRKSHKKDKPD
jgi:hypothetical protein